MKQKNISILALLLMAVTGAWAQGSGGDSWGPVQTSSAAWTAMTEGSTTGMTLGAADATTYYYMTENLTFSNNTAGGSGLTIQGTVYIYIPSGVTLTATGADGEGTTGGGAGILVPSGTTLNIFGEGTIVATGGNAANGGNGGNGTAASFVSPYYYAGIGGAGGNGGGGAGAGIGTAGGNGGNGAAQLAEASRPKANTEEEWNGELSGLIGTNGTDGATAAAVGTVNIASTITQTIAGGAKGVGGAAGLRGGYICYGDGDVYSSSADGDSQIYLPTFETVTIAVAGGGGGGGGAGGGSAQAIGTGGAGGGGGASGACGSGRAEESWVNDYWESVGAGGGAGGAGTDSNNGASGYTCYFENDYTEFDEEANHKPGGEGGSAGAASATKTAGTAAAPTYTITYFKAEGPTLSKTSETYTFGSGANITLPTITSNDGKDYKWMLSKYGRAFGETTSPCAGLNGTIYNSGDDISLSNVYGDLEFTTVYIGCQIDCRSQTESTLTSFDPDKYAVVNLKNRKLYKDGYWNTLTLPFNLSKDKLATTCLAGADIREFESASWDGGNQKLTINFSESDEIVADVPYIIRWGTPETATGETIVNPSFTNVEVENISQEELDEEENYCETESNGLRFEAQIGPVQLTSGSNALVFGSENKLYKPNKNVWVYPTRAYFSHTFEIASAREFVLDFGDGDQQTTYIDGITVDGNRGSGVEGIFNLSGQRLGAPQKGINIVNGKKVLVGDKR